MLGPWTLGHERCILVVLWSIFIEFEVPPEVLHLYMRSSGHRTESKSSVRDRDVSLPMGIQMNWPRMSAIFDERLVEELDMLTPSDPSYALPPDVMQIFMN